MPMTIKFQEDERESYIKHLLRTSGAGAGAGGLAYGLASEALLRRMGHTPGTRVLPYFAAAKGLGKGALVGAGIGAFTKPRKIKRTPTEELSAKLDRLILFAADPRPRNDLGMFTDQEGGPDPNAMYRTYHYPPPPQRTPGPLSIATNAAIGSVAGTGALTAATLGGKALIDKLRKVKMK